jgi:hypothetical protein
MLTEALHGRHERPVQSGAMLPRSFGGDNEARFVGMTNEMRENPQGPTSPVEPEGGSRKEVDCRGSDPFAGFSVF